jgi:transposase
MLADKVDFVIGVDTHRDSHTAAVDTAAGGLVERLTVATDAFGFRKLHAFAGAHATGRRVWAIE